MNERASEREALLHTTAEFTNDIIGTIGKLYPLEHFLDAATLFLASQAINIAEEAHILPGCQVKVECTKLGHIS